MMFWEVYVGNWKNIFVTNKVGILSASVTPSMSLHLSVTFVEYLNVPRERQIYCFVFACESDQDTVRLFVWFYCLH